MMKFITFSKNKFKKNRSTIRKVSFIFLIVLLGIFTIALLSQIFLQGNRSSNFETKPHIEKTVGYPFKGTLYFNDGVHPDIYSEVVFELFSNAQKTIDIAMYSVKHQKIIDILKKKKQQGIDVSIVLPFSKKQQHDIVFQGTDFDVITLGKGGGMFGSREGLMHNKFAIVDYGTQAQNLFLSSANMTELQEKFDPSFLLVTQDTELIEVFQKELLLLKDAIWSTKKLRKSDFSPFFSRIQYTNGFIEVWFSPGYFENSSKTKIISLIDSAKKQIDILGWQINDPDILEALEKKVKEGILVRVIIDDYYAWDDVSIGSELIKFSKKENSAFVSTDSFLNILVEKKVIVLPEGFPEAFNSFLHHHTLVVDKKILLTGTNNWTLGGFYVNDEFTIVTDVSDLVETYDEYIGALFERVYSKKVNFEQKGNTLFFEILPQGIDSLILYIEKSYPNQVGQICYETKMASTQTSVSIPEECITPQTRVFILDQNKKLQASSYLE